MLFPYTYVPHQMEKMQEFIDFIFHEVWCKAPTKGHFNLDLFNGNAELHEMMKALYYSDTQGADFFYGHIERIYGLFSVLTASQINQFQQWYESNNDLETACTNKSGTEIVCYKEIEASYPELAKQLTTFFKELYEKLDIAAIKKQIGDIDNHYQIFVSVNKAGKCPFCGIGDIKGQHHSKREAYDHYLPKALYPFNSINFRNLAPACHECNSTYKLSKDPLHNATGRRKAFYPYTTASYTIQIQITLQHADIDALTPTDIAIQFGPAGLAEEIETWKEVYGIEERYKAKFCGENDGKYWLTQVLDECQAYDKQPADILAMRAQQAQSSPYADCNFLRKPFLDACQQIGILDLNK